MHFCLARTFWVERHLDVVLEVLQVVGSKLLFYNTCKYLKWAHSPKKLGWLLYKWRRYLIFLNLKKKKRIIEVSKYKRYLCWTKKGFCKKNTFFEEEAKCRQKKYSESRGILRIPLDSATNLTFFTQTCLIRNFGNKMIPNRQSFYLVGQLKYREQKLASSDA